MASVYKIKINGEKKDILMIRNERREKGRIRIGNYSLVEVQEFKYLGSTITENNKTSKEIKARIAAGIRSYYALKNIFQRRNVLNMSKRNYTPR